MPSLPQSHTLSLPKAKKHTLPIKAHQRLKGRTLKTRNERIMLRDMYTCQQCGVVATDLEVDHRVPLHLGGSDADDNCWSLCVPCHKAKTAREATARADGTSQPQAPTAPTPKLYTIA